MGAQKLALILVISALAACAPRATMREARAIPPGNIRAAERFMWNNINYCHDVSEEDEWKPAEKTLADGCGDCEDYAIVARDIIETWPGWEARIVSVRPRHVVTQVRNPDGVYIGNFDNGEFVQ